MCLLLCGAVFYAQDADHALLRPYPTLEEIRSPEMVVDAYMQQLDASILREFVDKIYISEVYTPDENEPRIKVREIEIVYNFIGAFDFEEAREQSQAAQKEKKTGVA